MAIKSALAAALLVALVAVASATTVTTVTTSYDERGSEKYRQCSQQVQGREFQECQSYLKQRSRPYLEMEMEAESNPQQQEEYAEQCCEQLREMDRYQCGCEAIRHAVQKAQQQGGRSYQAGTEQIYERARALPRLCNLREQQCRFNLVFL
ncbi:2S seed storage albumin protein-like [Salvia miltiorrhiza]|uniref:2S seed storage albumin protein-like n=1 Tax=Salvia miltiorrhiza TaxID=226208 RepID=UPI0025ACA9AC|nr:2S seed storage albumin protein-like [Salvia miltiorrhiza]